MKNQKRLQVNNKKSTIFEIKSDSKISIDYRNHKNTIIKVIAYLSSIIFLLILWQIMAIKINSDSLKKYFGIFLIGIAIFEIFSFFKQYILKEKR